MNRFTVTINVLHAVITKYHPPTGVLPDLELCDGSLVCLDDMEGSDRINSK